MSFLNFLNEQADSLDGYLVESVDSELILEAVENFNDLPAAWKKEVTRFNTAFGKDSKFQVISKRVSEYDKLSSEVNKSIIKNAKNNGFSIIEVNNEPFALIIAHNSGGSFEYTVRTVDGKYLSDKVWVNGKARNNYHGYYEEKRWMKPTQARDVVIREVYKLINAIQGPNVDRDVVLGKLNFTVKNITQDEVRKEKVVARSTAKFGRNSDITELQRKAIRKYAAKAIKEIVDDITKSLPKIKDVNELLDDALEGKPFELDAMKDVSAKSKELGNVLKYFADAYKEVKYMPHNLSSSKYSFYKSLLVDAVKDSKTITEGYKDDWDVNFTDPYTKVDKDGIKAVKAALDKDDVIDAIEKEMNKWQGSHNAELIDSSIGIYGTYKDGDTVYAYLQFIYSSEYTEEDAEQFGDEEGDTFFSNGFAIFNLNSGKIENCGNEEANEPYDTLKDALKQITANKL